MACSLLVYGACRDSQAGEAVTSTIKYCYFNSITGETSEIPAFMWKVQGVYPNEYKESVDKKIDSLRCYRKDNDTIYAFEGWYYDSEYKNQVLFNTISHSVRGDLLLYAKIVERAKTSKDEVTASIIYAWDSLGLGEEATQKMTAGLSLPTEYVEGEGAVLPKLKTWKQNDKVSYRFEGWYYDANLDNKLAEEKIEKTQTGNLTIYPSIEIWVG